MLCYLGAGRSAPDRYTPSVSTRSCKRRTKKPASAARLEEAFDDLFIESPLGPVDDTEEAGVKCNLEQSELELPPYPDAEELNDSYLSLPPPPPECVENPDELFLSDEVLPPPPFEFEQSLISPPDIWTEPVPPSVEIVVADRQQGPKQLLFNIISSASQQGGLLLTDGLGYRYAVRNHTSEKRWHWACVHRDRTNGREPCRATISQVVFFSGPIPTVGNLYN